MRAFLCAGLFAHFVCSNRFLKDEIDSYGGDSIAAGRLVVSKLASIHLKQQVLSAIASRPGAISCSRGCQHKCHAAPPSLLPFQVQELRDHLFKWIDTDGNGFLEVGNDQSQPVQYATIST